MGQDQQAHWSHSFPPPPEGQPADHHLAGSLHIPQLGGQTAEKQYGEVIQRFWGLHVIWFKFLWFFLNTEKPEKTAQKYWMEQ